MRVTILAHAVTILAQRGAKLISWFLGVGWFGIHSRTKGSFQTPKRQEGDRDCRPGLLGVLGGLGT